MPQEMSDDHVADDDWQAFQRIMVRNALGHLRQLDIRALRLFRYVGITRTESDSPLIPDDVLEAIADPQSSRRLNVPLGPIVLLTETDNRAAAIDPLGLLEREDVAARRAGLSHLLELAKRGEAFMSPATAAVLQENAPRILDDQLSEHARTAAVIAVLSTLKEDFLFNVAGIRQCRQVTLEGAEERYWAGVLEPSLASLMSVRGDGYALASDEQSRAAQIKKIGETSDSLAIALSAYEEQCGHLPLVSGLSAASVVTAWRDAHNQSSVDIWAEIRAWAAQSPSFIRQCHAIVVAALLPDVLSAGDHHQEFWKTLAELASGVMNDGNELVPGMGMRSELALHFLRYIQLSSLARGADRMCCTALWAAERVVSCLEAAGSSPPHANDVARWSAEFTCPRAQLTNGLWTFVRIDSEASLTAYAIGRGLPLWPISLLSIVGSCELAQLRPETSSPEQRHTITKAIAIALGWVLPREKTAGTQFPWGVGEASLSFAEQWLPYAAPDEYKTWLEAAVGLTRTIVERADSDDFLKALAENSSVRAWLIHAFAIQCGAGAMPADKVWNYLCDGKWAHQLLAEAEIQQVEAFASALIDISCRDSDKWREQLPHLYAYHAEQTKPDDRDRRSLFFLLTLAAASAGRRMSAVRRLLEGEQASEFRRDQQQTRALLASLLAQSRGWTRGRLRELLAATS